MTRQTEGSGGAGGTGGTGFPPAGSPDAPPEAGPPGAIPAETRPGGPAGRRPRTSVRRARHPWRAAFFCVLAAAIVIGAAWALLGSSLLVVRHIEVIGNHQVPAAEVRHRAGIVRGTPLVQLDSGRVAARIERIAWVRSATVRRSWPDTVVITIRERAPELAVARGGQYDLVDVAGVVVRTQAARPAGVPLLGPAPAQLRGSPAVRAAVQVLGSLPGSIRGRVTSVTTGAADVVTLRLRGGIQVRWGGTDRSAAKARELRSLMRTRARYYDVSSPTVAVTGR